MIIRIKPEWEFAKLDKTIFLVTEYLDWQSFSTFNVNCRMAGEAHLKNNFTKQGISTFTSIHMMLYMQAGIVALHIHKYFSE